MFIRMLLLCLPLWVVSINASADVFWSEFSLGSTNIGTRAGLKLNFAVQEEIFSVGFSQINEGSLFGAFDNEDAYREVYVAYGLKRSGPFYTNSAQVGVGVFEKRSFSNCSGLLGGGCQLDSSKTVGIPLIFTTSFGNFFSINVNLNVNDIETMTSINLSFQSAKF